MNKWWVSISPPAVDSRKGAFSDRFHRVIAITDDISCGVSSATGQLQVLAQWHSSCVCLPQTEYYTVQIVSTCPGLFGCYFANQIPALWYLGLENKVFGLQWIWRLLGNGSEWYLRVFSTSVEKPSGSLKWVSDSQRMRSTIFATKLGKKKKKKPAVQKGGKFWAFSHQQPGDKSLHRSICFSHNDFLSVPQRIIYLNAFLGILLSFFLSRTFPVSLCGERRLTLTKSYNKITIIK